MRVDKGGVVDLAQSTHKIKKYEVKNVKNNRSPQTKNQKPRSQKDRLLAAKFVQKWWREVLSRYQKVTDRIIKLQSIWRGYWVRTYLYEIVYFSLLSQAFVEKFKPPIIFNIRRFVMDNLIENFADSYKNRLNFEKILKLQRKVKEFLNNIRDKRMKFNLRMEKIKYKIIKFAYDHIVDFSQNNNMKLKNAQDFLNKVKRIMRIRIFHQLLFAIFDLPVNQMKRMLRNRLMRNSFNSFAKSFLRKYYLKWWKNVRPNNLSDTQKSTLLKNLKNKIIQPFYNELTRRLRKMLPKGLREKVIRRLLHRQNKIYNEIILNEYFNRWRTKAREMATNEFKNTIFESFLFRTTKGMLRRRLGRVLKLWHLKATTKIDLAKVTDFLENIKKPLRRHAYNACKDKINDCCNGLKAKTTKSLFGLKGKFKLLTLRRYFTFWNDVLIHDKEVELQTKIFLGMKSKNFQIGVLKILAGRFQDWRRKTNMLAYLEKMEMKDHKKRKEIGTRKMFDGLVRYARRKAFQAFYPNVIKYLVDIIKSKALKRMSNMDPKFNKLLLRRYVALWRDVMSYLRKRDFRNKLFNKLLNNASSNFRKNFLRIFLQRWNRNKARDPLSKFSKGLAYLKNNLLRKNIDPLIDCFKDKLDEIRKKGLRNSYDKGAKKLKDFRRKFVNAIYKNLFYKWVLKTLDLKKRDDRNLVWSRLLNANIRKIYFRSIANRFSFWRSNKKEHKWDELEKNRKKIDDAFDLIKKKNHKLNDPNFWKRLKNHKSNKYMLRFRNKLISYTELADKFKVKRYLSLWRKQCKELSINDMKIKLLGFVLGTRNTDNKKLTLYRGLKLWHKNSNLIRLMRNNYKNLLIGNGGLLLKNLIVRRENFFFNILKRLIKLDARGMILFTIRKRLARPRYTVSRAFDRWRRVNDISKMREGEARLIEKLLKGVTRKVFSRKSRDFLMNRFKKWKKLTFEKPQDYYDRICRGVKTLNSFIMNKGGNEPFTLILNHKNYQRVFDKLLPAGSKLKKRFERDSFLRNWKKWRRVVAIYKDQEWACKILKNVKDGQLKTFRANVMQKYFRKFAGYKPKSLGYPDLVKAELRIKRTLMNRDWFYIKSQMKRFGDEKIRQAAIQLLFGSSKTLLKKKLRRALILWYKKMMKDDSDIRSKVLRNFKKMIIEKYFSTPLENGFRRWLRAMITKPRDIITPIVNATELLEKYMRKKVNPYVYDKINKYRSPLFFQRTLLDKILPKSKFAEKRQIRNRFLKWRNNANKLAVLEVKTKAMRFIYGSNREKFMKIYLDKYFKRFRANTLRKPVDFSKIIDGENIYFKTMVRKYLKGFVNPNLKDYAYFKYLRSLFNRTSKYNLKAIRPFLMRWKDQVNKMKVLSIKHNLWSTVVRKMTNEETKKYIEKILRNKLRLWRDKKDDINKKIALDIEKFVNKIKITVLKKHLPDVLRRLKRNAIDKKRNKKLNSVKEICDNIWNIILRKKLALWDKNVRKLQLRDLRIKIMQTNLKLLRNKYNKRLLNRAFQTMKPPKEVLQKNYSPLAVAMITTKRLLNRRPWNAFKERTALMNLKAPYGMPLSQVLFKFGKNTGKVMIMRNLKLRPYWRLWNQKVKEMEEKDLQEKLIKRLFFRNLNKNVNVVLRHYLRLWHDKKVQIDSKELKGNTVGRLFANIYGNNKKLLMRRFLRFWKAINDDHFDKMNKITLSSTKLINYYKRKYLNDLNRRVKNKFNIVAKKERAKLIWCTYIRKLDKGMVFLTYFKWKKQLFLYKLLRLKYNLMKNLVNKCERDKAKENMNTLRERLLKWRILTLPRNLYEQIDNIRKGEQILMRNLRMRFNREIFDKLKHKATKHRIRESLMKWLSKFDDTAKKELMRIKLRLWKIRLNDKKIMQGRLRKLFDNYLNSHNGYHELIQKPLNELKETGQRYHNTKNNSASIIQKMFRNLFTENEGTKTQINKKCLKSKFAKNDQNLLKKIRPYLKMWKKKCGLSKTEEAGLLIQNFLRGGVKKRDNVLNKITTLVDKLTLAIKKVEFNKIKERASKNRLRQILVRLMKDIPDEMKKEFYNIYFYRWWKHQLKKKAQDAGFLVTTISRGFLARKFARKLLKQKYKMNEIVKKLFGKHLNLIKLYYNRWNLITRIMKMSQAAKVIQNYLQNRITEAKKKQANNAIRRTLAKHFKYQVAELLRLAGKINKNSGEVLYATLRKIYYERPFEAIKKASVFLPKLRKLKHVYPILQEKFRLYWVPYYLRMWKTKTWDDKIRRLIQIQNWVRARIALWKYRIMARKNNLLSKYAAKMTNDHKLLLRIFLKNWLNRTMNYNMSKAALNLQKIWQGNTSRRNLDREVGQVKLRKLFRKLFIRMLNDELIKMSDFREPLDNILSKLTSPFENRYASNNLIDLAKNAIRNNILFNLTKRREFTDYLTSLRRYWELWHKNLAVLNQKATDVQRNYRRFLAEKELKRRLRVKNALHNLMLRNTTNLHGKMKICFDTWRNKANFMNLDHHARVIQDFVKSKHQKWRLTRIITFFDRMAKKSLHLNLLNMAKLHKLKESLLKIHFLKFYNHYKFQERARKLTWFFVKHLNSEDEKFKKLYLERYYIEWWERTKKLNLLRNRSALMIQNNFRRYLMEKYIEKEKAKHQRILKMVDKLTNDNTLRLRIRLHLWKGLINQDKLKKSADKIANFFADFKNKSRRKKNKKRLDEIKEGLEELKLPILKGASRYPFAKIKDEAGKDKFTKFVDFLEKKRRNHLDAGVQAIKDMADLVNKIRNAHAQRLQRKWKVYFYKKGIWGLINKIRKMRFIVKLMLNRDLRMLNKSLKLWKHISMGGIVIQAAKTIQDFCDDRILKYRRRKEQEMKDKYKKLAYGLEDKFFRLPGVKLLKYWLRIPPAIDNLKLYIFKKLRENVDRYDKLKTMSKLFRLPVACRLKVLRKNLLKWWQINDYLKKDKASRDITRALRNKNKRDRLKRVNDTLTKRLLSLAYKHSDLKRFYFMRWSGNVFEERMNDAAKKINDFVDTHWQRIKNNKRWKHMIDAYHDKNYLKDGLGLLRRYKVWKSLNMMFNVCDHKLKRDGFDELKKRVMDKHIFNLLTAVFNNYGNRNDILLKNNYLRLWRLKKNQYEERDNALNKFAHDFEVLFKIHASKFFGDAAICKRTMQLFNTVDKVIGMKKIKEKARYVKNMRNFKNLLNKGDQELADINKKTLNDTLYRIYTYKLLEKLTGSIKKCQDNTCLPFYAKNLYDNLSDLKHKETKFSYQDNLKSQLLCKPKRLSFSATTKSVQKKKIEEAKDHSDHSDVLPYLTPFLVGYLESLIRDRKRWALYKLKLLWKGNNLADKMVLFMKLLMNDKRKFFDNLLDINQYHLETPLLKDKLRDLLRRIICNKIKEGLGPVAKYLRLVYLCRLTFMHNDIADRRFNKEVIKRWKFLVHMQKLARKKMESMYKNFHIQYLSAAQDIFGDEENNAGMISEFSSLSEKFGMFKYEHADTVENYKRNFIKSSSVRKYNFGPVDFAIDDDNFENHMNENDMYANKTNKTMRSASNYEILDGDADESFIQGREDNTIYKKK
jgi:hypothetical protein